jgi:hypothetical protein
MVQECETNMPRQSRVRSLQTSIIPCTWQMQDALSERIGGGKAWRFVDVAIADWTRDESGFKRCG